jgi:hypothetical protein
MPLETQLLHTTSLCVSQCVAVVTMTFKMTMSTSCLYVLNNVTVIARSWVSDALQMDNGIKAP